MDLTDTHEESLRSYMNTRARALQNDIEETAHNRDSLTTTALVKQINLFPMSTSV